MSKTQEQLQQEMREAFPDQLVTCERCGESLDRSKAIWLELNNNTDRYELLGVVALADSQGCFAFGKACASVVRKAGGILRKKEKKAH